MNPGEEHGRWFAAKPVGILTLRPPRSSRAMVSVPAPVCVGKREQGKATCASGRPTTGLSTWYSTLGRVAEWLKAPDSKLPPPRFPSFGLSRIQSVSSSPRASFEACYSEPRRPSWTQFRWGSIEWDLWIILCISLHDFFLRGPARADLGAGTRCLHNARGRLGDYALMSRRRAKP